MAGAAADRVDTILLMSGPPARQTPQRQAILDAIDEAPGPLAIDEIHARAKQSQPGLGLATVYRAVRQFEASGQLVCVILPDGKPRYEAADLDHHHHFRCRSCDHVFDLSFCPVELPKGSTLPGGFVVESHELTLSGRCPACATSVG